MGLVGKHIGRMWDGKRQGREFDEIDEHDWLSVRHNPIRRC